MISKHLQQNRNSSSTTKSSAHALSNACEEPVCTNNSGMFHFVQHDIGQIKLSLTRALLFLVVNCQLSTVANPHILSCTFNKEIRFYRL